MGNWKRKNHCELSTSYFKPLKSRTNSVQKRRKTFSKGKHSYGIFTKNYPGFVWINNLDKSKQNATWVYNRTGTTKDKTA